MGIVRLAQGLRLLGAIECYTSHKDDIVHKITCNRLYMDFISIVYRVQDTIIAELNYLLYSFLLIVDGSLNEYELNGKKFTRKIKKFAKCIDYAKKILQIIKSTDEHTNKINNLQKIITDNYIDSFKAAIRNNDDVMLCEFVYIDVIKFVVDLVKYKLINVESILIAFDGMPSWAKVQEQRQRRYMRFCFLEFQRQLKYKPSTNKIRQKYDGDNFVPYIKKTIDYVQRAFESGRLKTDIFVNVNAISEISVEVINKQHGEGEKILLDRMITDITNDRNTSHNNDPHVDKSYVFYSPDGDSVMLCLCAYLKTKIENLWVVKNFIKNPSTDHNNQCQYVCIPTLYTNIANTIREYTSKQLNLTDETKDNYCRDFIFLMNFFGNDFVHKIPTLDISTTLLDILFVYAKFVSDTNKQISLTFVDNGIVKINYRYLKNWLNVCAENEELFAMDTYMTEISDRKRINRHFGDIFTLKHLCEYVEIVTHIKSELKQSVQNGNKRLTYQILSDGIDNLNKYMTTQNKKRYGEIMVKAEVHDNKKYVNNLYANNGTAPNPTDIYDVSPKKNVSESYLTEIIDKIEQINIGVGSSIVIDELIDKQPLQSLPRRKAEDIIFIYKNIRTIYTPHGQMPTSERDIDFYMLEWRSGRWKTLLNSKPFDFGFDYITNKAKPIDVSEIDRYRLEYLYMDDKHDVDSLIESYLQGLSWVNDYYFNSSTLDEKISTWAYCHDRGPLFKQINDYITNTSSKKLKMIMNNVYAKSLIDISAYMTSKLHKLYIYPIIHTSDSSKIVDSDAFPNIVDYVSQTIAKNEFKYFDCNLCPFFSKCIFKGDSLKYHDAIQLLEKYEKFGIENVK